MTKPVRANVYVLLTVFLFVAQKRYDSDSHKEQEWGKLRETRDLKRRRLRVDQ